MNSRPIAAALLAAGIAGNPGELAAQSLAETIDQALAARGETSLARLDTRAAQARLKASRASRLPALDLTVSNDINTLVDPFTGITATAVLGGQPVTVDVTRSSPRSVLVTNLRLSYPLYTGGKNEANINAARFELDQTQARALLTSSRIARSVALAWFAIHRENLNVRRLTETISIAEKQAAIIRLRVRRGLSARIDNHAAQSDLSTLLAQLSQTRATRTTRWIELCRERGLVQVLPEPNWSAFTNTARLAEAIAMLRQYAPDNALLQERSAQVNEARERLSAERSAFKPKVSLFAQYSAIGRSAGTEWVAIDRVRRSDVIFGARLEWNLFEGYGAQARVAERAATLERTEQLQKQLAQEKRFAIAAARSDRQAQSLALRALTSQIALLDQRLDIARVRIKSGRADERAILTLQRDRVDLATKIRLAQLDILTAHTREIFARAIPDAANRAPVN